MFPELGIFYLLPRDTYSLSVTASYVFPICHSSFENAVDLHMTLKEHRGHIKVFHRIQHFKLNNFSA